MPELNGTGVQMVLRLRVPDSHSDCPLGEKYGAAPKDCSQLVSVMLLFLAVTIGGHGAMCPHSSLLKD